MVTFPNAKINIGLHIVEKRPDGYHNLESCFYPIKWEDVLEVIEAPKTRFTTSGLPIFGNPSDNLCLQAYSLLQKDFDLAPVHIHLHKVISVGAGLGGGSSDAAHTLKLLNGLFDLQLDHPALERYAFMLGSDCPFFICDEPVLAYQRGEMFKEITVELQGKFIALVNPGIHVSTAEAYAGVRPSLPPYNLKETLSKEPAAWKGLVKNDFEYNLFLKYPMIRDIKAKLYKEGALFASMSGSGPTVYGIFDKEPDLDRLFPNDYTIWKGG